MSTSMQPPTQLTRDETRILEACERESFIYRSLPYSVCTFFAIQYAMSKNIISTKAKLFKLGAGVFAGYMTGKFSYAIACQKKILMEIPDSNLAKMIRGVENRQISDIDIDNHEQKQMNNLNEIVILESDNHLTSVGTNQYGDPIYRTNK
ncbi:unnamed protein product [Rotaria sp. Silwood2]|nr:unnamed protein product [Rotaria sp. Silwood2]CAF3106836.1 unnamed protein product [Rotaria sp. Silwood2]CAF3910710.1 unnamed protein product [Rotaria sp. Silwood2]CAF4075828.1 unnamed protein product [Rotaria sp. Silwood2]